MRVRFLKGEQRNFLNRVIEKINSPSLRGLLQFGLDINYSTLKNYYNEDRMISEGFLDELCEISGINKKDLYFELVEENWGKVKGGKKGRRK